MPPSFALTTEPRSSRLRRTAFIEFRIYWEGRINRRDLIETFGISEPQAAIDFRKYQESAPLNLSYDRRAKCYVASKDFKPLYYTPTAEDYFHHLARVEEEDEASGDRWASPIPNLEVVAAPSRAIQPEILREVVSAIRNGHQLKIRYLSMSDPSPRWMTAVPRALVFAANRWHARTYRLDSGTFIDVVLSRILKVRHTSESIDVPDDIDWSTLIDVVLVPNPYLQTKMQDVVRRDYSMKRGRRVFQIRRALLFYFINTLPGDFRRTPNKESPREQEVIVSNFAKVREALGN